ncbi:MAG: T9SS type A sorting domain-containing protein [Bacteroidetes bacterium]|nr:T9SS type A sorting domain-containing protein [Bacteroidota bacterium]MBU1114142.1 T9SS type A sorting domain-containing protein [Bacteroidota bacterium]MBU1796808.1 T9SS type A sorting domain-containing protein [Bacteroidota bacterium]
MKKQIILLTLLVLSLLLTSITAKTIYFKPEGIPLPKDDGSPYLPYRNFKSVLDNVVPGDKIELKCDWDVTDITYWSNRNTCLYYGGHPGSIVGWSDITFDGDGNKVSASYNGDGFTLHFANCNTVTIQNMTIERIDPLNYSSTNYCGTIRLRDSDNCTLNNLEIIANGDELGAGISLHQSYDNTISNITGEITGSRCLHFAYLYHNSNNNNFTNCTLDTYGPNNPLHDEKGPPLKVRDNSNDNTFNNINVTAHTRILAGWIESYVQGSESYSENNKVINCTFTDNFSSSSVPKISYNMYANSGYTLTHPAVQGYWTNPNMQDYVVGADPGYINQTSNTFSEIRQHDPDPKFSRYFPLFNVTSTEPNIQIEWKDWDDRWEISCTDNKPRTFSVDIEKFISSEWIETYDNMERWVVENSTNSGSVCYSITGAGENILFSIADLSEDFDLFLLPGFYSESYINSIIDNITLLNAKALSGCKSQNSGTSTESFSTTLSESTNYWAVIYKKNNYGDFSFTAKPNSSSSKISVENSEEVFKQTKSDFSLNGAFPNPFNPTTQIMYSIPENGSVKLEIYNMLGEKIKTLVNQNKAAGSHHVTFDATKFSSGVYIYSLQYFDGVKSYIETKKLNLVK